MIGERSGAVGDEVKVPFVVGVVQCSVSFPRRIGGRSSGVGI